MVRILDSSDKEEKDEKKEVETLLASKKHQVYLLVRCKCMKLFVKTMELAAARQSRSRKRAGGPKSVKQTFLHLSYKCERKSFSSLIFSFLIDPFFVVPLHMNIRAFAKYLVHQCATASGLSQELKNELLVDDVVTLALFWRCLNVDPNIFGLRCGKILLSSLFQFYNNSKLLTPEFVFGLLIENKIPGIEREMCHLLFRLHPSLFKA